MHVSIHNDNRAGCKLIMNGFLAEFRRNRIAVGTIIQCKSAIFVRCGAPITSSIETDRGEREKSRFVFREKLADLAAFIVMLTVHVTVTGSQKFCIFRLKIRKIRHRY